MTNHEKRFDAVVLLCGGPHKNKKGNWGLNFESSFKAKAAGFIYNQGLTEVIISSGGAMWGAPPLGELMKDYLIKNSNSKYRVPETAFITENDCTDTSEQIQNIMEIIQNKGFRRVGVLADSVHLKVVIPLFNNWGQPVEGLAMEEYLLQANPGYQRVINKLRSSLYWKWWNFKYSRLQKALIQDPKLESPIGRAITRFQRTKLPWLRLPGTT